MKTQPRTVLAAAILGGSVLLTSACSAGRPSVGDIEKGLSTVSSGTDLSKTQIACIATVLHDSKVSDQALKAIAGGNQQKYAPSAADKQAAKDVATSLEKCATTK